MVLEEHCSVKWFTPTNVVTSASAVSSTAIQRQSNGRSGANSQPKSHVELPSKSLNTVTQAQVTNRANQQPPQQRQQQRVLEANRSVSPWSVYGPTFERLMAKSSLQITPRHAASTKHNSEKQRQQQQQQFPYPKNSVLAPSQKGDLPAERSIAESDTIGYGYSSGISCDELNGDSAAVLGAHVSRRQPVYFADMPLELLDTIFLGFLHISHESLNQLAQVRSQARIKASKQAGESTSTSTDQEETIRLSSCQESCHHIHHHHRRHHLQHQLQRQHMQYYHTQSADHGLFQDLHNSTHASSSQARLNADSIYLASSLNLHHMMDQELSYDGEEEDDYEDLISDSGDEAGHGNSQDDDSSLTGIMSNLTLGNSDTNHSDSNEGGDHGIHQGSEADDSGSQDIVYGYQDDSMTQSSSSSSVATSFTMSSTPSTEDEREDGHTSELGNAMDTEHSSSGASITATTALNSSLNSSKQKANKKTKHYYRRRAPRHCCCHHGFMGISNPPPTPRLGINRVDNDLEESKMLYQLHRDQYFHPTTHTSLRSDLYICSLVNRHWRIAALQVLWQSVVLDSESCRPEPSDPCACCGSSKATRKGPYRMTNSVTSSASSSTSTSTSTSTPSTSFTGCRVPSSSSTTRIVRTRLEAMLDSYLEIYGLDLAKCVQTVELDLRLLIWSAEGESVKRILKRLSPFTHLRLVWAGKESPEEMTTGFKVAMESLHSQIRHLHFFSGFVVSKAWVREMDKMTKLETVTIESLGTQDVIEYDWSRLKCLTLNSLIPRSVFGHPTTPTPPQGSLMHLIPANIPSAAYISTGGLPIAATHSQALTTNAVGANAAETNNMATIVSTATAAAATTSWLTHQHVTDTGSAWSANLQPVNVAVSTVTTTIPAAALSMIQSTSMSHSALSPERLRGVASGWWQWTGLRKLEIRIENTVLPREWLQDLTTVIIQNSAMIAQQEQQQRLRAALTSTRGPLPSRFHPVCNQPVSFGPPLEVLTIDCEVSHPHKDIFMDLVRAWGHHLEEFHFAQSSELTDDFFMLCLQRMTRLKKLSLRDSKGITGEGIRRGGSNEAFQHAVATAQGSSVLTLPSTKSGSYAEIPSSTESPTRKSVKVPILWRRDFCELNLEQSRVRQDFLETLKSQCPGVRYKVREMRRKV
ncbi:hypothetical protein BGZ50_002627 [Haplosporangium sp. Z 11]|nr:hypothetical protein BGZ50_002627 [Haplosporangium sp. Z 11]